MRLLAQTLVRNSDSVLMSFPFRKLDISSVYAHCARARELGLAELIEFKLDVCDSPEIY